MSAFQGNTMAMPSAGNNTKENIEAAIAAEKEHLTRLYRM